MQKETFKVLCVTCVLAATGFLLRWLQNMRIYGEDGLVIPGLLITGLLIALMFAAVVVFLIMALRLKRFPTGETVHEMFRRQSIACFLFGSVSAVALFFSGWSMIAGANEYAYPTLRSVLGVLAVVAAVGIFFMLKEAGDRGSERIQIFGAIMLTVFTCVWLITIFRENSGEPEMWRFLPEILAGCSMLVSSYYITGFQLEQKKMVQSVFSCELTVFFCFISIIDENPTADMLVYTSVVVLNCVWMFLLVENLIKEDKPVQYKL